jgi:hypothetical protein
MIEAFDEFVQELEDAHDVEPHEGRVAYAKERLRGEEYADVTDEEDHAPEGVELEEAA